MLYLRAVDNARVTNPLLRAADEQFHLSCSGRTLAGFEALHAGHDVVDLVVRVLEHHTEVNETNQPMIW